MPHHSPGHLPTAFCSLAMSPACTDVRNTISSMVLNIPIHLCHPPNVNR